MVESPRQAGDDQDLDKCESDGAADGNDQETRRIREVDNLQGNSISCHLQQAVHVIEQLFNRDIGLRQK
jgi:hypothetical protein